MRKTYASDEIKELTDMLKKYGVEISARNDYCERRLYFDQFYEAAMEGYINRFSSHVIIL